MSHAGHEKVACGACGVVLLQCRCIDPGKTTRTVPGPCASCGSANAKPVPPVVAPAHFDVRGHAVQGVFRYIIEHAIRNDLDIESTVFVTSVAMMYHALNEPGARIDRRNGKNDVIVPTPAGDIRCVRGEESIIARLERHGIVLATFQVSG